MHLEFSFTPLSRKPRSSLQQGKDSSLKFLNKFPEPSSQVKAKQTTVRNLPPNPGSFLDPFSHPPIGHTDADRWLRSFQIRQTPELILSIRDTTRLLRQESYTLVKMMFHGRWWSANTRAIHASFIFAGAERITQALCIRSLQDAI